MSLRSILEIAAALIGILGTIVGILAALGKFTPRDAPPPEPETLRTLSNVKVGECFDGVDFDRSVDGGYGNTITLKACHEPHQYQLFARVPFPNASAEFPGNDAISIFSDTACDEPFTRFVGRPNHESAFDTLVVMPGEEPWREGDRNVLCAVQLGHGMATINESARDQEPRGYAVMWKLNLGTCFDSIKGAEDVATVVPKDCRERHQHELYASEAILRNVAGLPDEATIRSVTRDLCLRKFTTFVGIPAADSELGYLANYPHENEWKAGRKIVACAVQLARGTGRLTASVKGTKR